MGAEALPPRDCHMLKDCSNCFCCACALGTRISSEDDEEENFFYLSSYFPKSGLLGPWRPEICGFLSLSEISLLLITFLAAVI